MRRFGWWALLPLMMTGCSDDSPPAPVSRPVALLTLAAAPAEQERFAGTVQARYESTLAFRVNGRLTQRLPDVGSVVARDQLLAALDPTDQDNALRERQAQTADAEAQYRQAAADAARQRQLFAQGVGSRSQLDQVLTRLHTLEAQRAQTHSAERQSRDQRGYTELRSEFAGVVTAWQVEVGQVVSAGQPVVRIARPEEREAVLDLPASLATQVGPGTELSVWPTLQPELRQAGRIREIEPQADTSTRTQRVRVTLPDPPAAFRLGASVQGALSAPAPTGLLVPVQALRRTGAGPQVWVVEREGEHLVVHARTVSLLREAAGQAWLGAGVRAGERVVVAGVNSLQEGQVVREQGQRAVEDERQ